MHLKRLHVLPILLYFGCYVVQAETKPLSLDDAIELALENNQDLKVSAYTPQIARANLLSAYGQFDPVLALTRTSAEVETPGTYAFQSRPLIQTDNYGISLTGLLPWGLSYSLGATVESVRGTINNSTSNYDSFAGVSVTQPLLRDFGFNANLRNIHVARANRGISLWQHQQIVIDIVTQVIYAFNSLQQAHDNFLIAQLSRDLAAQLLEENQKRRHIGSTSDADVTQARARVASREEAVLIAERNVCDLEYQLRQLLGHVDPTPTEAMLTIVKLEPAAEIKVNPARDYQKALELRPDYQAAKLGIKIDLANERYHRNQLLPRVDFIGYYGYSGLDHSFPVSRSQVRNREARAYSAGIAVSVPVTFSKERGAARAAYLARLQSDADLLRFEQDIAVRVAKAAGQIETTRQRVIATEIALNLAQQSLNAEQKRFNAGTSSTYLVLQQQELLASAQNSKARALADQRRALAAYEREIGTTLKQHRITTEPQLPATSTTFEK